jgi:hypothetical protein
VVKTLREPMARKKPAADSGVPDGPQGTKTTVKLWEDLARKAKIVAAIRGVDLFDYLDSIIRPVVERDHSQAIKDEAKG